MVAATERERATGLDRSRGVEGGMRPRPSSHTSTVASPSVLDNITQWLACCLEQRFTKIQQDMFGMEREMLGNYHWASVCLKSCESQSCPYSLMGYLNILY